MSCCSGFINLGFIAPVLFCCLQQILCYLRISSNSRLILSAYLRNLLISLNGWFDFAHLLLLESARSVNCCLCLQFFDGLSLYDCYFLTVSLWLRVFLTSLSFRPLSPSTLSGWALWTAAFELKACSLLLMRPPSSFFYPLPDRICIESGSDFLKRSVSFSALSSTLWFSIYLEPRSALLSSVKDLSAKNVSL